MRCIRRRQSVAGQHHTHRLLQGITVLLSLTCSSILPALGQLAITEVMSSSAVTHNGMPIAAGPDYWELTNYGSHPVDLNGFRFNDNAGGLASADSQPFIDQIIQPGVSFIFVQSEEPKPGLPPATAESFRRLWGLDASVAIILYSANGFGAPGDEVQLWDPSATTKEEYVDRVIFGESTPGRSFTYNSHSGLFGGLSTVGVDGAFRAAQSDDVGSPGVAPAPIQLAIIDQPRSVAANAGDTVTFTVSFRGLPKPSCAWYFNADPVPIARGHSLVVTDAQLPNEGRYHARLDNGRSLIISDAAVLTLRRQGSAPTILGVLEDRDVYIGQDAKFQVVASGSPQPTLQWWFNDTLLEGVVGNELELPGVQLSDAGRYSVVATNPLGAVTNSARLNVTARPRLRITEVMSAPSTNSLTPHEDWWELTNMDDHPVDLFGYRFDDGGDITLPGLSTAWTNPGHQVVRPGESVIFVENLSAVEFRRWWGPANLPDDLQIITYRGAALSLSAARGDVIWFWNPGATDNLDYLDAVDFVPSPLGRTFGYIPDVGQFVGISRALSMDGVHGAFVAADGGDIGSPGYITAPRPKILEVIPEESGYRIRWRTIASRHYTLETAATVDASRWETLSGPHWADGGTLDYLDRRPANTASRYYRVMLEPQNP